MIVYVELVFLFTSNNKVYCTATTVRVDVPYRSSLNRKLPGVYPTSKKVSLLTKSFSLPIDFKRSKIKRENS